MGSPKVLSVMKHSQRTGSKASQVALSAAVGASPRQK
jgi:hypothetical protein